MSGDVQPRKRKDKKKKREDEASHGVHITKMGSDDVHLHIHEEHGTGGHWCAKIIFFSLMTILMGLVCLIILENRGISDVDTPLSESRFSNYFDGWVDESRDEHDDHHDTHGSVEHDDHDEHDDDEDEDDHDDEPFEEEADHSEGDEEVAEEEDENVTPEEEDEDDDNATAENVTAEDEDEDEDDEENITAEEDVDDNATAEEADDDDNVTAEDENVTEEATVEQNDEDDEEDNKTNEEDEDDNATTETSKPTSQAVQDDDDDDDDAFEEEDDDGTFDSLEKMVDNDAAEIELLKEKARQQAAAESKENAASAENDLEDEADNAPSWASSLAVKIGVGLALALVARLVLIRKNPISTGQNEAPAPERLMKRRLTIASPDEFLPEDVDVVDEPLPEDDYSEEEIEIEEEIEYIEEDVETIGEENQVDAGDNDYSPETFEQLNDMYRAKDYKESDNDYEPETFEQLNAMYRPKDYKEETQQKNEKKATQNEAYSSYQSPYSTSFNNNNNRNNNNNSKLAKDELPKSFDNSYKNNTQHHTEVKLAAPVFEAPPPPPLVEAKIDMQPKYSPPKEVSIKPETSAQSLQRDVTYDMDYEKSEKEKPQTQVEHKKDITHDMDYQPDADEIDYDEDDIYDDDEAQDDDSEDLDDDDLLDDEDDSEEGDDEEVSDVDDTELMNRLEAKYGKLPAKEYESDEDPDDPTWTRNY